jgi:hypothetical protein
LGLGLGALLLTRSDIDATLLRAPGSLFQQSPAGKISNLYLLKLTNKTHRMLPVEIKLEQPVGTLTVLGGELNLAAEKQTEASVLIEVAPEYLASGTTPVRVGIFSAGRCLDVKKTIFIGPRR